MWRSCRGGGECGRRRRSGSFWRIPSSATVTVPKPKKGKAALPLKRESFCSPKGLVSKSQKQGSSVQNSSDCSEFQTPRSWCRSPTTSSVGSGIQSHQCDRSVCSHTPRRNAAKSSEVPRPMASITHQDSSGSSFSTSSSSILGKILDRCIDGEQQMEKSRPNNKSWGKFARNGRSRRPSRAPPSSPTGCIRDEVKAHFRDAQASCLRSEVPRPMASITHQYSSGSSFSTSSSIISGKFARNGRSRRPSRAPPSSPTDCIRDEVKAHFRDAQASCLRSEVPRPMASITHQYSSGSSFSTSSSIISGKILDHCIDGEQQMEKSRPNNKSRRKFSRNGRSRHPPRAQPSSPTGCIRDEEKAHFRDAQASCLRFSSRNWADYGFGQESPRRLAKNVVARLAKSLIAQKTSQKELEHEVPVTVEEVCGGSLSKCLDSNPDMVDQTSYSLDEPCEPMKKCRGDDYPYFQKPLSGEDCEDLNSKESEELQRRLKEAEERFMLLSKEVEQESFLQSSDFDVPSLVQMIRIFAEERVSLALEVSSCLHSRIADRDFFMEKLRFAEAELESQTRRVENEKNDLQSALERELDRRSSDWSIKLEKSQFVSLQGEAKQLKDTGERVEDMNGENQEVKRNLSEEDRVSLQKKFETKEKECEELHKTITRLQTDLKESSKELAELRCRLPKLESMLLKKDAEMKKKWDDLDEDMAQLIANVFSHGVENNNYSTDRTEERVYDHHVEKGSGGVENNNYPTGQTEERVYDHHVEKGSGGVENNNYPTEQTEERVYDHHVEKGSGGWTLFGAMAGGMALRMAWNGFVMAVSSGGFEHESKQYFDYFPIPT